METLYNYFYYNNTWWLRTRLDDLHQNNEFLCYFFFFFFFSSFILWIHCLMRMYAAKEKKKNTLRWPLPIIVALTFFHACRLRDLNYLMKLTFDIKMKFRHLYWSDLISHDENGLHPTENLRDTFIHVLICMIIWMLITIGCKSKTLVWWLKS